MDSALVDRINEKVGQDDTLYHLGDWSFGEAENVQKLIERINCRNIHLLLGNHDKNIKLNRNNCKKFFSSVKDVDHITIDKQEIFMSHYSHTVWNGSHKGVWHLYGHSHGTLKKMVPVHIVLKHIDDPKYLKTLLNSSDSMSMDVGVDTNDLYPYSFEDIQSIMEKKKENIKIFFDAHGNSRAKN